MRLLLLLCLLPVYSIADNLNFSASVDTHFHVISPANWQESKLAALKVIDAPIDGETAKSLLDEAGFAKAVVISSAYLIPDASVARTENDYLASLVSANPDRFYGMCSVSVHHAGALDEVERCIKDLGLSGLKLHLFADNVNLNVLENVALIDSFFKKVAEMKKGLPVLIDFNWMDAAQIVAMMQTAMANPDTTIIMAHGLGHHYGELINVKILRNALRMNLDNLYIDLSATLTNYPPGSPRFDDYIWHLRLMGVDKILLGSDYPAYTPKNTIDAFLKMGWTPEEQQMILSGNAARLFK